VFTAALAWAMLGNSVVHVSWRVFAAVVSLPAFVCWLLTYVYVPESAQYYARLRKYSDAEAIVNGIRATNAANASPNTLDAHPTEGTALLTPFAYGPPLVDADHLFDDSIDHEHPKAGYIQAYSMLFDPVLRTTTISLLLSWFCLSFGSYGLATWITVLFKRINLSDPFANAFIYAAANLPGNLYRYLPCDGQYSGRACC